MLVVNGCIKSCRLIDLDWGAVATTIYFVQGSSKMTDVDYAEAAIEIGATYDGEISQQGRDFVGDEISDGGVGARDLQSAEQMNFESCHRSPVMQRP